MIVFCGYANLDVVARVPALPRPEERIHASGVVLLPGGMAANAAVAAARSGASVVFAGVLGDDSASRSFLDGLDGEGVDSSWTDRSAFLSTAVVLVDAAGRRAVISQDDALGPAQVTAATERLAAAGGGLLYLDGYRAEHVAAATRPGISVVIDLDGCDDREQALAAVRGADHVVVGRRRLDDLLGVPPAEWPRLARESDTRVLVTDGARGWTLYEPDGTVTTEGALPVPVVDDTGAGDCFAGTYLAGIEAGLAPPAAARRAGIAASLSCTVPGARGAPRPAEVDAALLPLPTRS